MREAPRKLWQIITEYSTGQAVWNHLVNKARATPRWHQRTNGKGNRLLRHLVSPVSGTESCTWAQILQLTDGEHVCSASAWEEVNFAGRGSLKTQGSEYTGLCYDRAALMVSFHTAPNHHSRWFPSTWVWFGTLLWKCPCIVRISESWHEPFVCALLASAVCLRSLLLFFFSSSDEVSQSEWLIVLKLLKNLSH